ncbi:hypothetical protein ASG11_12270 [Sphingomonas sp. Leaf357]|uniref:hypothetical protein n=1 Tax=Sphingomonas sp. Leaf357 TaxID=1736350 RepID=UPI0006FEA067|nr:hypothetical protein [Sphingomonas sp. Leaf357]KQS04929.1 hypothetical protein ASG11_12270 [Sphingomonas sp. Leaf357]
MLKSGLKSVVLLVAGLASWPGVAAAQRLGPDYSQRGLPGGNDTTSSASDLSSRDTGPVACVYQFSHRIPFDDLIDIVRAGYAAKTRKQQETFHLLGETIATCRAGQGWGAVRQNAALQYFSGRIFLDDAVRQGRDLGLNATILRALSDHLDAATKAAFDSGKVDGTQMATAMAGMGPAGLDPAKFDDDQRTQLAHLVAQGLWGMHLQEVARASFKKG